MINTKNFRSRHVQKFRIKLIEEHFDNNLPILGYEIKDKVSPDGKYLQLLRNLPVTENEKTRAMGVESLSVFLYHSKWITKFSDVIQDYVTARLHSG